MATVEQIAEMPVGAGLDVLATAAVRELVQPRAVVSLPISSKAELALVVLESARKAGLVRSYDVASPQVDDSLAALDFSVSLWWDLPERPAAVGTGATFALATARALAVLSVVRP